MSFFRKRSLFILYFRRKFVESDTYLARLIVYTHNNPVHHRFCNSAFEWEFSSLRAYSSTSSVNVEEGLSFFDLHRTLKIQEITSELE
jgi:hypothetical protein